MYRVPSLAKFTPAGSAGLPDFPYTLDNTLHCINIINRMGYKLVYKATQHPSRIAQETLFIRSDIAHGYGDIMI